MSSKNIATAFHTAGTANDTGKWLIFINGMAAESDAITSIVNDSTTIVITLNTTNLNFSLESGDEVMLWGPMVSA